MPPAMMGMMSAAVNSSTRNVLSDDMVGVYLQERIVVCCLHAC